MQILKSLKILGLAVAVSSQIALILPSSKVLAEAGTAGLRNNETLYKNQYLLSPDGTFKLILQDDGNLVVYNTYTGEARWNSGTVGQAVNYAVMQSDGNFVIYGFSSAIWSTNTAGNYGAYIQLQNDGNLVIYKPTAIWAIFGL